MYDTGYKTKRTSTTVVLPQPKPTDFVLLAFVSSSPHHRRYIHFSSLLYTHTQLPTQTNPESPCTPIPCTTRLRYIHIYTRNRLCFQVSPKTCLCSSFLSLKLAWFVLFAPISAEILPDFRKIAADLTGFDRVCVDLNWVCSPDTGFSLPCVCVRKSTPLSMY